MALSVEFSVHFWVSSKPLGAFSAISSTFILEKTVGLYVSMLLTAIQTGQAKI